MNFDFINDKICRECAEAKKLDDFRTKISSAGNICYESVCKKCNYKLNKLKLMDMQILEPEKYAKYLAKRSARDKKRYYKKKDIINKQAASYYKQNRIKIRAQRKEYRKNNLEKVKKQSKKFYENINNRLSTNLRRRVRSFMKTGKNWNKYLGCDIDYFKKWLEFNFEKDKSVEMTFDNYGEVWQLEHVYPCSKFDLTNEEEVLECFNWKNTIPLEKFANQQKNNTIVEEDILKVKERVIEFEKLMKQSKDTTNKK